MEMSPAVNRTTTPNNQTAIDIAATSQLSAILNTTSTTRIAYANLTTLSACFVSVSPPATYSSTRRVCESISFSEGNGTTARYSNTTFPGAGFSETHYFCIVPHYPAQSNIQAAYTGNGSTTYFCQVRDGNMGTNGTYNPNATTSARPGNGAGAGMENPLGGVMGGKAGLGVKGVAVMLLMGLGMLM